MTADFVRQEPFSRELTNLHMHQTGTMEGAYCVTLKIKSMKQVFEL